MKFLMTFVALIGITFAAVSPSATFAKNGTANVSKQDANIKKKQALRNAQKYYD